MRCTIYDGFVLTHEQYEILNLFPVHAVAVYWVRERSARVFRSEPSAPSAALVLNLNHLRPWRAQAQLEEMNRLGDSGTSEEPMSVRIFVCVAFAAMLSACDSDPTRPTPVACGAPAITIGRFTNGAPASPGQGMVWSSYFGATVLPAAASVYVVDINYAPAGCVAPAWTAVSADTSAVQLSPASGSGRSQVELFMPANSGAQRSTLVTIAGQTATITQSAR